jgi:hypothetical protein
MAGVACFQWMRMSCTYLHCPAPTVRWLLLLLLLLLLPGVLECWARC